MKKNADVKIGDLANILIVGESFDKYRFSEITGIKVGSSNQRLSKLLNDGFFEFAGFDGPRKLYRMTAEHKLKMIKQHKINQANPDAYKPPGKRDSNKSSANRLLETTFDVYWQQLRELKFI